nr:prolyl oligopeptidase family serine peptidase [Acidobacteriota bacterium]
GWDSLQVATRNARGKSWAGRVQLADKPEDIVPSWKLQMSYDPMPALEKVRCPVLSVFGELDTLTPVLETTANYRKGLSKAGNSDYTIKVFPDADHALLVWPKPNASAHWPVLAAGYLETMTGWIDKHTAKGK